MQKFNNVPINEPINDRDFDLIDVELVHDSDTCEACQWNYCDHSRRHVDYIVPAPLPTAQLIRRDVDDEIRRILETIVIVLVVTFLGVGAISLWRIANSFSNFQMFIN